MAGRIRSIFLTMTTALLAAGTARAEIAAGGPTRDGEVVTIDLDKSQHLKNVGGTDGAGLCVFTSITHSARYQWVEALLGFRKYMEGRPGGGWPEKVTAEVQRYCDKNGLQKPTVIQHAAGDMEFLKVALRTGRMPAVTYDGRDGVFYRGRIAHMVNLVHLSDRWAVILDNNYPGQYLWMSPEEFRSRWLGNGGGWAVVLLDSPPPPVPVNR